MANMMAVMVPVDLKSLPMLLKKSIQVPFHRMQPHPFRNPPELPTFTPALEHAHRSLP